MFDDPAAASEGRPSLTHPLPGDRRTSHPLVGQPTRTIADCSRRGEIGAEFGAASIRVVLRVEDTLRAAKEAAAQENNQAPHAGSTVPALQ